ncbi:MAG: hypothetical protein Q9191_001294 [Dirinaria sp. TL-2023a]
MAASLRSLILNLESSGHPTNRELRELHKILNRECLHHSGSEELLGNAGDYTPDDVSRLALNLSKPLAQAENWQSSEYRIQQLRVLVAALALLHHLRVQQLHPEPYSQLRQRIADRFKDIVYGHQQSLETAAYRIQYIQALYYCRLAGQYFSLFKRRQPPAEALAVPVLGLVLAGASIAGGQYNSLQSVFKYLDQIIAEIPNPRGKDVTLPTLQEIVRNTVTTSQNDRDACVPDEASRLLHSVFETRADNTSIEFFLSHRATRHQQRDRLEDEATRYSAADQVKIKSEIKAVYAALEENEPAEADESSTSRSSSLGLSNATTGTSESLSAPHHIHSDAYKETQVQSMEPRCQPLIQIPREKNQSRAGLSKSCRFIYFHDTQKVVVHRLCITSPSGNNSLRGPSEKHFSHGVTKGQMIQRVAIDGHWIAISTNKELVIINMEDKSMTPRRAHGDWEPVGLALHKSDTKISVVLGQCKRGRNCWEGRVLLFKVWLSVPLGSVMLEPSLHSMPQGDKPMNVDISSDGTLFLCLTRLHNSVIIWKLLPEPSEDQAPFIISRSYTPETGIYGITSASIYTSGKSARYLVCTTFASTERWLNGGEWPFCSPIVFPPTKWRSDTVHNLESLKDKRSIVAAAVSSQANVLAVLELNGRISVLNLKAHEREGMCVSDEEPTTLEVKLSNQTAESQICPSALQFDPSGTKLFALGVDGKLVVVDFVDPRNVLAPWSPSSSNSSKTRLPLLRRFRS